MRKHYFPTANKVALALAGSVLVAAACESSTTAPEDEVSHFRVLLTDAPHEQLDSAIVWISRIYLQGGGGTEPDTAASDTTAAPASGRVDLYNDPTKPLKFDLLKLRDGVTADLTGLVEVDVGKYQGLRFVVDSARVILRDSLQFQDGTRVAPLKVPSGSTSGIKVKVADIFDATGGDTTTVTVDFDVDDNFKIQQNPQTGVVNKVMFTPVLKEKNRQKS